MKNEKSRFFYNYFNWLWVSWILCNSNGLCAAAIPPEYVRNFNGREIWNCKSKSM